jgi:hypothetical protein
MVYNRQFSFHPLLKLVELMEPTKAKRERRKVQVSPKCLAWLLENTN